MEIVLKETLKDGSELQVVRFAFPGVQEGGFPDWLLPLLDYELPDCWHTYYHHLLQNGNDGCEDFIYAGLVNGTPCARMWFGYSSRTGAGNFGNVHTYDEFRKRGIMSRLLACCVADFHRSGALFCSCDAASRAAPAYAAAGFCRIFDENHAPMAIVRKDSAPFPELVRKAYRETAGAVIRQGTLSDRFDCDKLLAYDPDVYEKIERCPEIPDYLTLWSRAQHEQIQYVVLESCSGFCAGYAFRYGGIAYAVLHPRFGEYRERLLAGI